MKFPLILAGAAALALTVSGCAALDNIAERDPVKEAIAGCNTIAGALNVLAPNKQRLTAGQIATVDRVDAVSRPICTADEPPASSVDLITDLAAQIVTVQATLGEDS